MIFAFDPVREAVFLVAGDKSGRWQAWYRAAIPLADATGLSQARISQIENGDAVGLDTLRAYVVGLGGRLDIVARIGNIKLNVA